MTDTFVFSSFEGFKPSILMKDNAIITSYNYGKSIDECIDYCIDKRCNIMTHDNNNKCTIINVNSLTNDYIQKNRLVPDPNTTTYLSTPTK